LIPAQFVQALWVCCGFSNFLVGLKASSAKFGHHSEAMRQWNEMIPVLTKEGVGYEENMFRRKQIILLVIVALINGTVDSLQFAHLPESSNLNMFDASFVAAPFEPTMTIRVVQCFAIIFQMMIYSIPVCYTITLSIILRMHFRAFHRHLTQEIRQSDCKIPETFQELRILHNNLCGLVNELDKDMGYCYGNSFVWMMLTALLSLYMMLKEDLEAVVLLAYAYFLILSIGFLMAISIFAALVNEGVSSNQA